MRKKNSTTENGDVAILISPSTMVLKKKERNPSNIDPPKDS